MASYPINFRGVSAAVAFGCISLGLSAADAPNAVRFHKEIEPLLQKYCYDCHGDGARKGNVAFDEFASDADLLAQKELWLKALKNVRAGLMPPPEDDSTLRPTAEEVKKLETWIKFDAFGLDANDPDPGRITVRRLNRVEYRNTIRDLMGVEFASEVEFPPDDTGHGFDNLGEVLTVSPLLLEKYLQAAEEIVDKAVPRVSRVPVKRVVASRDFQREAADPASTPADPNAPAPDSRGEARRDLNARRGGKSSYTFNITQAGVYKLAFDSTIRSSFDFDTGRANVVISLDGVEKHREEMVWGGKPIRFESEQSWAEGPHQLMVDVQPLTPLTPNPVERPQRQPDPADLPIAAVGTPPAEGAPPVIPVPNAVVDGAPAPAAGVVAGVTPQAGRAGAAAARGNRPPANRSVDLRITSAELVGPMDPKSWVPPENYRRFFSEDPPTDPKLRDAFAEKTIRDFATRAFRRPVSADKVAQLVAIARTVYSDPKRPIEDGIARAIMAVLASPRFLFRIEEAAAGSNPKLSFAPVDEFALASRLSYFLWSSMPDEELTRLASRGELRKGLSAQVDRMLKDSKSQAFVQNFPGQWLQARDVESIPINARAVLGVGNARGNASSRVDFNAAIRKALRSETEMYFEYVLREDRSVLELIDSDYTFLNSQLATHYGIPGVEGTNIRRVTLPPDSPRGGVLTQGSVLAVTSNPTRTSPVKRGLFILENILGTPPPPPPPDVPALEEVQKAADGRELSLREALAAHRTNALCNSCHSRMDPLGFALENFNAMGNWRDMDAKQKIDPSGKLATGESFADVRDLKRILANERRLDFYRCLTEKMMTYALGRGVEYHDIITVDQIVEQLEKEKGRFSVLLAGIIESAPFQKLRTQREPVKTAATDSTTSTFANAAVVNTVQ